MENIKPIPVILEGDPGHDDAIAWVLANSTDRLKILGVCTSAGNQTIEKTTYNAQRILTLIGYKGPLAKGRTRPLIEEPMNAPSVHGESGLDGPVLPEPEIEPVEEDSVVLMARLIEESEEPVTLVPTGPLTNIAALLTERPDLKPKIARISLMGGGLASGNWTPAAEFNILVDPEAADVVFRSGVPILMAGLDVTEKALIFPEDFERIRAVGNPVAKVVAEWLEFFYHFHRDIGYTGAPVHDPCAVAALLHPEIMTMKDVHVDIELTGKYCRGMTVADMYGSTDKKPNVRAILNIDRKAFADLLVEAVKAYDEK
ncbi:MAG: nucleoside hydrolase [Clostridia bacterium]|nr:nucleoside hydrolase [Clostridia bacterium]